VTEWDRGAERPASRAVRLSPGRSAVRMVLPKQARPAKAGLRSIPQITDRSQRDLPVRVGTPVAVSQRASSAIATPSST
jgi:hypothetical protein